jgi:hypothetical protein
MAKRSLVDMVELSAIVPRGHAGFWAIICDLDRSGPWRICDVDQRSNVDRASIKDFVRRLERGGYLGRAGEGPGLKGKGSATLWRLLRTSIDAPRLDRAGNELPEPLEHSLWRTMRIVKQFTARELADMASLPERRISLVVTQRYMKGLATVQLLLPVSKASTGLDQTYRLVRDLGPKAPSITRAQIVFDPNARQVVGVPTLDEVAS